MRKVCVVTNTRADYSRLKTLIEALRVRDDIELSLCVGGSHLLPLQGQTIEEIRKDGHKIDFVSYSTIDGYILSTMAKSAGIAMLDFATYFENHRPDIVVVHGDRYEAMAVSLVASMMNIHVAHLQGGDITGTIDEHLRHAITKLSHFHFVTNDISKKRICGLGENPGNVFNFGCPSTDVILSAPEYSFPELKKMLAPKFKKTSWLQELDENFFLMIYHPVTTEYEQEEKNIEALLNALERFPHKVIALWPNVDAGSRKIVSKMKAYERNNDNKIAIVDHFSMDTFINIMRHAKVMIGNSSAGMLEACYFGTPVVNIGTRQNGRPHTANIINVSDNTEEIVSAIEKHLEKKEKFEPEFPYGKGNAGKLIADVIATVPLNHPQKKLVTKE